MSRIQSKMRKECELEEKWNTSQLFQPAKTNLGAFDNAQHTVATESCITSKKSAPNTVATHGDAHIPSTTPFGISPFIKKLSNLAKNLPDSIPEASDSDKLVKFGQDLANFNNKMFDKDSLWKEETNLCLKHVLGWGTEGNMKDLVQW